MASWGSFASAEPDLAAFGRERIERTGVSYLGTVRPDGAPRVHPVTPRFTSERMYLFMEPTSPKGHDLRRDPRYVLHGAVEDPDGGGGEFLVRGRARVVDDPTEREQITTPTTPDRYVLFELGVDEAVGTRYLDDQPQRTRWRADDA